MFLVPAAIFASLEKDWNYLDSLYYCFISLTTIGLGDFIPGDTPGQPLRPLYKACTTCRATQSSLRPQASHFKASSIPVYLLSGVAAMMLSLSVFYNIPQCNFKLFFMLRPDQCLGGLCGSSSATASSTAGGSGSHQRFRNEEDEDSERIRLQAAGAPTGPRYTQHLDEPGVSFTF